MANVVSKVRGALSLRNPFRSSLARTSWAIVLETVRNWDKDNVSRLAAALSCYTILSVAPLVILSVAMAAAVFGQAAARGQIALKLGTTVGPEAAQALDTLIQNARAPGAGLWGTGFGVAVLLLGASGVFVELQSAMNQIWKVDVDAGRVVKAFLRHRVFSFAMVVTVAALLLGLLMLSATLTVVGRFFGGSLPGGVRFWQVGNLVGSIVLTTGLFALVFKVVPDIDVTWRNVLPGAFVTAVLFALGKAALSVYVEKSSAVASFGAVGSLVALLVWVYVSSQIFFFGVEFTAVWVNRKVPDGSSKSSA